MKTRSIHIASLLLIAGAGLAGCQQRSEDPTVGQQVDKAIDSAKQGTKEAKNEIKNAVEDAKNAGAKMEGTVNDASITAGVNVALTKDSTLSALKINVDTQGGRVALSGTAPDEAARSRASELAAAVKGVLSVDNRLTIEARS